MIAPDRHGGKTLSVRFPPAARTRRATRPSRSCLDPVHHCGIFDQ